MSPAVNGAPAYFSQSRFCSAGWIVVEAPDGNRMRLDARDGPVLAAAAARGDWTRLVPLGLDRRSQARIMTALADLDDPLDLFDLFSWAMLLAPHVYGVAWHLAGRLCAIAEEHWTHFDGWCLKHGYDPSSGSAQRICVAVTTWLYGNCHEEKEVNRLELMLYAPPDNEVALERIGQGALVRQMMGGWPGGANGATGVADSQSVIDSWNALPN